jgi:8-oxo-dGTP pyrophosphatase MutT (NUDIX family)
LSWTNQEPPWQKTPWSSESGKKKLKLPIDIAHQYGIIHESAGVLFILDTLLSNGELQILLQKRSESRYLFPHRFTVSAGGHVNIESTPISTTIEEVEQEIGLSIRENELSALGRIPIFSKLWKFHRDSLNLRFTVFDPRGELIDIEGSYSEADRPLIDQIRTYIAEHIFPDEDCPEGLTLNFFNRELH